MKTRLILSSLAAVAMTAGAAQGASLTYTTGLDVWLDANNIDGLDNSTLTDGGTVTTWTNLGTTGTNNATRNGGTASATYAATGGDGGQAAVTLNNTRFQFGTGAGNSEFNNTPSFTMFFVVNNTDDGVLGDLITDYGSVTNALINPRANQQAFIRDASGTTANVASGSLAFNSWDTIFFSYDASTKTTTWGESGSEATTTNAAMDGTTTWEGTAGGPATLFSFHDGNNSHDFNGLVSQVLIYDHILSTSDRATVEAYIAASVPEPSSLALLGLGGLLIARRRRG